MAEEEHDAGERTEDPTAKRLDEAIRRGDVAKSYELSSWFLLAGGSLAFMLFAAPVAANLQAVLGGLIAHSYQFAGDGPAVAGLAWSLAAQVLAALALPLLLLSLAALAGTIIQHRIVFSAEPIKP
jgi:flagellar biosynthesis protein FlhB